MPLFLQNIWEFMEQNQMSKQKKKIYKWRHKTSSTVLWIYPPRTSKQYSIFRGNGVVFFVVKFWFLQLFFENLAGEFLEPPSIKIGSKLILLRSAKCYIFGMLVGYKIYRSGVCLFTINIVTFSPKKKSNIKTLK